LFWNLGPILFIAFQKTVSANSLVGYHGMLNFCGFMSLVAVVGMQWGDEGKGKVVDLLSESASHIARAQGGNNAGHTVVVKEKEYQFHLIPSGILYPHAKCYIGGGTIIDPKSFLMELEALRKHGISFEKRLFLSRYAHVVFPYHRLLDGLVDQTKGNQAIGTTKRGIGPCYSDKVNRLGLRLADLLSPAFRQRLKETLVWKNRELEKLYDHPPLDFEEIASEYEGYAQKLAPFVAPVEEMLFEATKQKEKILFEGAQGSLLDVTFGTYPFVTSSCTISGGIPSGLGVGPCIDRILGVVKAYTTRVGNGPFPSELLEDEKDLFPDHTASREIGVTTGRKRRIGWFDAFLVSHTIRLNGANCLAIMKMDILDGFDKIKICTGYKLDGHQIHSFPATGDELGRIEPIYETLEGWKAPTGEIRTYRDLPKAARAYLRRIQELCGVEIGIISVGPARDQTLWMDHFFSEVS
jgi:adenylosuccinate synthase